MDIQVRLAFHEAACLRLLQWLAEEDARLLHDQPSLPLLYDSHVVYQEEVGEVWSDVVHTLAQGHEDCDALAAWRAGELIARGARALAPGEPGYRKAQQLRLDTIDAEVMLTTRVRPGQRGLFHCIVRYRVGGRWYRDDPSARLGMNGRFDPRVTARRARRRSHSRRGHAPRVR